jgi:hypothetical protein
MMGLAIKVSTTSAGLALSERHWLGKSIMRSAMTKPVSCDCPGEIRRMTQTDFQAVRGGRICEFAKLDNRVD